MSKIIFDDAVIKLSATTFDLPRDLEGDIDMRGYNYFSKDPYERLYIFEKLNGTSMKDLNSIIRDLEYPETLIHTPETRYLDLKHNKLIYLNMEEVVPQIKITYIKRRVCFNKKALETKYDYEELLNYLETFCDRNIIKMVEDFMDASGIPKDLFRHVWSNPISFDVIIYTMMKMRKYGLGDDACIKYFACMNADAYSICNLILSRIFRPYFEYLHHSDDSRVKKYSYITHGDTWKRCSIPIIRTLIYNRYSLVMTVDDRFKMVVFTPITKGFNNIKINKVGDAMEHAFVEKLLPNIDDSHETIKIDDEEFVLIGEHKRGYHY